MFLIRVLWSVFISFKSQDFPVTGSQNTHHDNLKPHKEIIIKKQPFLEVGVIFLPFTRYLDMYTGGIFCCTENEVI